MPDPLPDAEVATWRTFLTAHARAVALIESDLEAHDLIRLEWYDLLFAIQEAPDHRLRMMDLADRLLLTRSNATRLVDRLEGAGLIKREQLDMDRRGTAAVLTASGREALRRAWPVYASGISHYFLSLLSRDERRVLASSLGKVAKQAGPSRPASRRRSALARVISRTPSPDRP